MRTIIVAAALVLAGGAVWLTSLEREDAGGQVALFPDLTIEILNGVKRIEITERSTLVVSVYKAADEVWRVKEHHGHPADTAKIRQLLSDLKDATRIERKTSSPEHYATLGVADPTSSQGDDQGDDQDKGVGRLLAFSDANQTRRLIVGRPSRQVSRGQYVRKPQEAESWLINVAFQLPAEPAEWLDKEVVHIEPSEVSTVTLSHSDGVGAFTIARGTNEKFAILDLPQGRTSKDPFHLNRIATVTDYLKFKNVFVRGGGEVELPDEHFTAHMLTTSGLSLWVKAYKTDEGNTYFTLDAEGVSAQAEEFGQRFSKWLYEVSGTTYEQIAKRLDDFLQDA